MGGRDKLVDYAEFDISDSIIEGENIDGNQNDAMDRQSCNGATNGDAPNSPQKINKGKVQNLKRTRSDTDFSLAKSFETNIMSKVLRPSSIETIKKNANEKGEEANK